MQNFTAPQNDKTEKLIPKIQQNQEVEASKNWKENRVANLTAKKFRAHLNISMNHSWDEEKQGVEDEFTHLEKTLHNRALSFKKTETTKSRKLRAHKNYTSMVC